MADAMGGAADISLLLAPRWPRLCRDARLIGDDGKKIIFDLSTGVARQEHGRDYIARRDAAEQHNQSVIRRPGHVAAR